MGINILTRLRLFSLHGEEVGEGGACSISKEVGPTLSSVGEVIFDVVIILQNIKLPNN